MLKRAVKVIIKILKYAILLGLAVLFIPRLITALYSIPHIYTIDDLPPQPVAIVFGAGLWRDGTPTNVLKDRINTAADLFFSGKVKKILMSGDNRFLYYNEPGAMKAYAVSLGVPEDAIVLDYAGRRTYDTCHRARSIFGVKDAVLVTQRFHLPRALYTCNMLGVNAVGVSADQHEYRPESQAYWNLREIPATLTAFLDLFLLRPVPVLGQPEPIFPDAIDN